MSVIVYVYIDGRVNKLRVDRGKTDVD